MSQVGTDQPYSRWPHRVAVALVCATFPLIWAGGLVTTYDAGMSVPDWPSTYGYNMFLYPLSTWWSGPWDLFIEHSHRLLGTVSGMLTIALTVVVWNCDGRRWLRWASLVALALVIFQGMLGGLRVQLDSTLLARAHGCTGPLFFAWAVILCAMTSQYWSSLSPLAETGRASVRGLISSGWTMMAIAYVQLVLGAHLRHPTLQWLPRQFRVLVLFHIVVAFALLIQAVLVRRRLAGQASRIQGLAGWLVMLVGGQITLGVVAWRAKYAWPSFFPMITEQGSDTGWKRTLYNWICGGTITAEDMFQTMTVTAHVAMGSLILACAGLLAVRISRAAYLGKVAGTTEVTPELTVATSRDNTTKQQSVMSMSPAVAVEGGAW